MQQTSYTMQMIAPEEGKYLTQKAEMDIKRRVITPNKIYLSVQDNPDDWKEISAEEAEALFAEQKEAFEAAAAAAAAEAVAAAEEKASEASEAESAETEAKASEAEFDTV